MLNARKAKRLVIIFTCVLLAEMMYNSFFPNDSFSSNGRSLSTFLDQIENHKSETPAGHLKNSSRPVESPIEKEEGCWRKCPHGRINRISYSGDTGGLSDRKFIIRELAELAGYLCAQLILPKPARILHPLHNNGKNLDPYLQWADVFNITFAEDNMPVIVSDVFSVPGDYERVVSHGGTWKEGFKKIQEYSWKQKDGDKGLAWDILDARFYSNDLTYRDLPPLPPDHLKDIIGSDYNPEVMAPKLVKETDTKPEELCQYTSVKAIPSKVQAMKTRLSERIREISPDASSIGIMHLRRGDAIQECDTRVVKVKEFLSCSLRDTERKGNITILLQSDEQSEEYRQNIMNLQNDFGNVKILDLDYLARQVVNEAVESGELHEMFNNNYFIFDVGSWVQGVKFSLLRRRMLCDDCTPLAELL